MAGYSNPQYLIEPEDLADALAADPRNVRVFDATVFLKPAEKGYRAESGRQRYEEAHIPGAAFLDQIEALSDTSSGLGFTLPAADVLGRALEAHGIGDSQRVVVYSSAHMMWATRAWWLVHYAGHDSVAVLNGGLEAWRAAGFATASGSESHPESALTVRPRASRFVDAAGVLDAIGDPAVCTVNALSPDVYSGSAAMSYGRKGHITGSVNLHYDRLLDAGRFLPADRLERALAESGLLDAERVIAYCGGGISATIDAFACLLIGRDSVAVYDGSMSEWVRDPALPMTTGEERGTVG